MGLWPTLSAGLIFLIVRSARYFLIFAVVGMIVAIGSVFAITAGISSDTARNAIERRMGEILGLPIRLRGRTEIHLFPAPYAVFNGVRVASEANQTTIEIERVEADFDVLSLFRSIPTFSAFRMQAPRITLGVDDNGIVLWPSIETVARQLSATDAPPELTDNLDLTNSILENLPSSIGRISFIDGSIRFVERDGTETDYLNDLQGILNWPNRDGAFSLQSSFSREQSEGRFDLSSNSVSEIYSVEGGNLNTSLQFNGALISFAGRAALARPRYADGTLDFELDGLRSVNAWIDSAPLLTAGIEKLGVSGEVSATQNRLRIDDADVTINDDIASGAVELLRRDSGRGVLTATLAFDALDLARLATPAWRAMQRSFEPDGGLRAQMTGMDIDLRVSASSASLTQGEFTQFAGALSVRDDLISFDIGDAAYEGGSVQLRYKDEYKENASGAYISFRANDVDSTLISDKFLLGPLFPRGRVSMTGDFNGSSGTLNQFWRSATGKFTIASQDGAIPGVELGNVFEPSNGNQFMALTADDAAGDSYETLNGTFNLSNAALIVDQLSIAYPQSTLQIDGIISPINGSVALTSRLQNPASDQAASRVFVGGTLRQPYATQILFPFEQPAN
ncbi:MAG: AsmA family protein [Pseudomonadota bacterium]